MKRLRLKGALTRLEAQLESGDKTAKRSHSNKIKLTADDVVRINKEIAAVKSNLEKTR